MMIQSMVNRDAAIISKDLGAMARAVKRTIGAYPVKDHAILCADSDRITMTAFDGSDLFSVSQPARVLNAFTASVHAQTIAEICASFDEAERIDMAYADSMLTLQIAANKSHLLARDTQDVPLIPPGHNNSWWRIANIFTPAADSALTHVLTDATHCTIALTPGTTTITTTRDGQTAKTWTCANELNVDCAFSIEPWLLYWKQILAMRGDNNIELWIGQTEPGTYKLELCADCSSVRSRALLAIKPGAALVYVPGKRYGEIVLVGRRLLALLPKAKAQLAATTIKIIGGAQSRIEVKASGQTGYMDTSQLALSTLPVRIVCINGSNVASLVKFLTAHAGSKKKPHQIRLDVQANPVCAGGCVVVARAANDDMLTVAAHFEASDKTGSILQASNPAHADLVAWLRNHKWN